MRFRDARCRQVLPLPTLPWGAGRGEGRPPTPCWSLTLPLTLTLSAGGERGRARLHRRTARPIDRRVGDAGDGGGGVGEDEAVELDEAVALPLVVGGDLGAYGERVADAGGGEVVGLAGDVNPGTQHDIVSQRPVEEARQLARVRQALAPVEGVALAHVLDVARRPLRRDGERLDAEAAVDLKRDLVRRHAL